MIEIEVGSGRRGVEGCSWDGACVVKGLWLWDLDLELELVLGWEGEVTLGESVVYHDIARTESLRYEG